jgi:putative membrane protein
MFEAGFLGTRAPLFMDLVTIYFALLPFLVGYSIVLAVKGRHRAHFKSQAALFLLTMVMVVIFEIGVRLDGGFNAYMNGSNLTYSWVLSYLLVHIAIALFTVVFWGVTIYRSMKVYVKEGPEAEYFVAHKKTGKRLYLAIVVTALMGCSMYPLLFVL